MQIAVEGITLALGNSGAISVLCGALSLGGGWPVVDGKTYRDSPFQVIEQSTDTLKAEYNLGPDIGRFALTVSIGAHGGPVLKYGVSGVPAGRTFSNFGLHFDSAGGIKRYYSSGYHSWDGSYYVQPDTLPAGISERSRVGRSYALTQLVPEGDGVRMVLGFDRNDRFLHTFSFGTRGSPPDLTVLTVWDEKPVNDGQAVSENLCLLADIIAERGLVRWAKLAATASPTLPRTNGSPLIGWDSWYDLYNFINEGVIRSALANTERVVKRENLPTGIFLIDAGFTPELGDWLATTYTFPNGMKPLADEIRNAGFTPGLWIAPLLVGNRSELYAQHPDWLLKERRTGKPKLWAAFYGEQRLGHMRSEEYFILDPTHPDALEYLRKVFRTWRTEWGVQSFKIDFTFLLGEWGPDEVSYQTPGLTRIEAWRKMADAIRQEIGEDGIWIGSGQPLWASIGIADSIRIGGDVGVTWTGTFSAESTLRDLPSRNFANHILWQVDPDAVLLRTRYHRLSDTEVRSLALFDGMSGGVLTTSDNLAELPPERIELWRSILSTDKLTARYPLLASSEIRYVPYQTADGSVEPVAFPDPVIVQVRDLPDGSYFVHILNNSTARVSRTLSLRSLGIEGEKYGWELISKTMLNGAVRELSASLEPHGSVLFYVSTAPRARMPANLRGTD